VLRSAAGLRCRRAPKLARTSGRRYLTAVRSTTELAGGRRRSKASAAWVKVEAYKDSKGETRTKVTEIKPVEKNPEEEADFSDIGS